MADHLSWTERMVSKGYLSRAQLATERQALDRALHELRTAEGEFRLFQRFQSEKEIASLRGQVEIAERNLELETSRLKAQEEQYAHVRKQIERCIVRAPQDGVAIIARKPFQWRKFLEPGVRVYENQELFKLPDLSRMEVVVSLHESMGPRVKVGMPAAVRVASLGERALPGRVASITTLSEVNWKEWDEWLRHFIVRVRLDKTPPKLLPLMSAVVEIDTGRIENGLVIPVSAMSVQDHQQYCYVLGPAGLERRDIKTRHSTRDWLEVTAGLEEGERVVTRPARAGGDPGFPARAQTAGLVSRGPPAATAGAARWFCTPHRSNLLGSASPSGRQSFTGRRPMRNMRCGAWAIPGLALVVMASSLATAAEVRWKKTVIEGKFRSEGVAVADVNKDGKLDVLVGDSWYEAPGWTKHDIRKPGDYGDGLHSYSECMTCWADDINGDGWADQIVIGFPGSPALWYENPKGQPGYWTKHEIWPSACNETPLYADLFGDGRRVLVMGWQPKGKDNEGQMAWFTPGSDPTQPWEMHAVSEPSSPGKVIPGHVPVLPRPGRRRPQRRRPGRRDLHRRLVGAAGVGPRGKRALALPSGRARRCRRRHHRLRREPRRQARRDRQLGPQVRHLVVRARRGEGRLAGLHPARPLPGARLRDARPDRRGHQRRRR